MRSGRHGAHFAPLVRPDEPTAALVSAGNLLTALVLAPDWARFRRVSESSIEVNQREFSRQVELSSRHHHHPSQDADWVFAAVPRTRRDLVLDVAAGTGAAARSLAADVRQVIALDVTEAMLAEGAREAREAGVENILFMRGDAAALPFLDDSFATVLCRFALHHFPDPRVQLAEIKRVLAPRGWLGLADLVVAEDPAVAQRQNAIGRLANASYTGALSASALQDTLVRSGFEVAGAETRETRRPAGEWLATTPAPDAAEICAQLEAELNGGERTGLSPRREPDGSLSVARVLTSLLVLNPDA
jgi:ubiquinone/menaquinone biosynthesis C-methylase UbiE